MHLTLDEWLLTVKSCHRDSHPEFGDQDNRENNCQNEGDLDVPLTFGSGTVIQGAIIDKNVRIGKNVKIVNESNRMDTSHDHPQCVIRDGIPIVMKNVNLPDGWDLEKDV